MRPREPSDLEDRIISVLEELRDEHPDEHFGAMLVLGYNPKKHSDVVGGDITGADYFEGLEVYVRSDEFKEALYNCATGKSHDGAILVDEDGKVVQNDTWLHVDCKSIARKMRAYSKEKKKIFISPKTPYCEQFGFLENTGLRHWTARCLNWETDLVVITLSADTGCVRKFADGRIAYSDIHKEVGVPVSKEDRENPPPHRPASRMEYLMRAAH